MQEQLVANWISRAAAADSLPFEIETWDGDMAALGLRIRRGVNTWDMVHVEAQDAFRPDRGELFESFPQRDLGRLHQALRTKPVIEEGVGMPVMEWAYVLTYRYDKLQVDSLSPPDWRSLWDLERYPGTRGIRDWPMGIIEIALVALGRDVDSVLYASGLTRPEIETQVTDALDHLSRISAHTIWWDTGDQLQRGVASGEMVLATGYSGRVGFEARQLCPDRPNRKNCPIGINPATAIVATDWWVIPKNARRREAARQLLEAMYSAPEALDGARTFSATLGYRIPVEGQGVTTDPIESFITVGSSANSSALLAINERFWGENFTWINDRWRLWRSQR